MPLNNQVIFAEIKGKLKQYMETKDNENTMTQNPSCLFFFFSFFAQSLSHVQLFVTPWTIAYQAPLSFIISWSLFKFMPTESVILSNYLILCCSHLLLPSIFPRIRVFSNELALYIRQPKYWSFSLQNIIMKQIFKFLFYEPQIAQGTC